MVAITLLAFTRNRATNVLPLILGLFFKVSGTSSRVMTMLSNVGMCVSGRTVERLKKQISDDAVAHAAELMKSGIAGGNCHRPIRQCSVPHRQ